VTGGKGALLRAMLAADRPTLLAGAHDGLSARLVEEAGFDAVWASGFEISASHGVPDASVLTMTEMLAAARQMNAAVGVPVVADCDGGFGNAINTIHMVKAYEDAGIAGLCIEDTVFPKRCSLYDAGLRELTPLDEQALKIQAACETRRQDTLVIARTEALVAGLGLDEARMRAHAYADAGADAILVHSAQPTADEVFAFAARWTRPVPLVAVPTTYSAVHADELWSAGYRVIIFANQALRAAIRAVRETLCQLRTAGFAESVDDRIVPLADVFELVHLDDLKADEQRYMTGDVTVSR
jgi:phosphoenolpyruvate phosphomutase